MSLRIEILTTVKYDYVILGPPKFFVISFAVFFFFISTTGKRVNQTGRALAGMISNERCITML